MIQVSLKHGLLGLLNYGPMTGYELDKVFKDSLNFFWQAQTSQIYRELNAMEKSGWLTSEIEIQTGKPNKKLYSITDAGKKELLIWLSQNTPDEEFKIRSGFLLKLFFSGERSVQESIAMLKAFQSECEKRVVFLSQTDSSIEQYGEAISNDDNKKMVYWSLTARFGKAYMDMCLDFAGDAIKILEGLS